MSAMLSVEDFITEYNYMCAQGEAQPEEVVRDLYSEVSDMFQINCGYIPNFELVDGGRTIKLIKGDS